MRYSIINTFFYILLFGIGGVNIGAQNTLLHDSWEISLNDSEDIPEVGWRPWNLSSVLPTQQVFWLRSTIINPQTDTIDNILYLGSAQEVDIIIGNNKTANHKSYKTGTLLPFSQRSMPIGKVLIGIGNSAQEYIQLPPGSSTLSLRYHPRVFEQVPAEIRLFNEAEWHRSTIQQKSNTFLIQGLIAGSLLIISIYHFLIFVIRRDKTFFWYAVYTGFVAVGMMIETGVLQVVFFKELVYVSRMIWETQVISLISAVLYFAFMRSFIDLKKLLPWLDRLVFIILLIMIPFSVFLKLYYVSTLHHLGVNFIPPLTILLLGLYCVFQLIRTGNKLAMYFSIGSLVLFTCVFTNTVLSILVIYQVIPEPTFPRVWFTEMGIIFEILIFSLGLGYRLRLKDQEQELSMTTLRRKISSDLHDDVGTMLSGLSMQADVMKYKATGEVRNQIEEISQISRNAMDRMRDTVWAIDSRQDQYVNLVDRIREHTEKTLDQSDLDYDITSSGFLANEVILPNHRQQLYLIFKEALTNTIKHAQAKRVKVNLHKSKSEITFTISDDGIGNHKSESTGQGLENIKMRVKRINGTVTFKNHEGFCIRIVIPLTS